MMGGAVSGAGTLDLCSQQGGGTTFFTKSGRLDPGFDGPEICTTWGPSFKKVQKYV